MKLNIKDTFNTELPADPIQENYRRQVKKACYSFVSTRIPSNPSLIHTSIDMLKSIGLTEEDANSEAFLSIFSGKKKLENSNPYAMCYAGHQFGSWAGQLGDGRAINLAEIEHDSKKWTLQLKGAGETPYSRSADGLAVLRSSIREYLCSEAMFYLGVPTTRALSIVLTGDEVLRDVMYDGNPAYEKGAIVCRTSPSFIRFGSFEIFAAQQDFETQKQLIDYTIKHHFQHLGKPSKEVYVQFFKEVTSKSLAMVIDWQRVGFVHGVMNTDNMSILGLTIDYGPYGWLEGYDHGWTPNTTDNTHKRYRFGAQPQIVQWNLYQLANAIFPLIEDANALESILVHYKIDFEAAYLQMMKSKIGLFSEDENDKALVENLEQILQLTETDMTLFFRYLASFSKEKKVDGLSIISDAFYHPTEVTSLIEEGWKKWFLQYKSRLQKETLNDEQRILKMNQINPKYVLRNYMAQLAIDAADKGDYTVLDELFNVLKKPYDEQPEFQKWFAKRPEWARHKVGCSMLSCSS